MSPVTISHMVLLPDDDQSPWRTPAAPWSARTGSRWRRRRRGRVIGMMKPILMVLAAVLGALETAAHADRPGRRPGNPASPSDEKCAAQTGPGPDPDAARAWPRGKAPSSVCGLTSRNILCALRRHWWLASIGQVRPEVVSQGPPGAHAHEQAGGSRTSGPDDRADGGSPRRPLLPGRLA